MFRLKGQSPTGLRLLCYLCILTGLWIPNHVFKLQRKSILYYVVIIFEWIIIIFLSSQLSTSVYQFLSVKELNVTSLTSILMPVFFNLPMLFNFIYLFIFRKYLITIFQNLQDILNFQNFGNQQSKILRKIDKVSFIYFTITTGFSVLVITIIAIFMITMMYGVEVGNTKLMDDYLNFTANTLGSDTESVKRVNMPVDSYLFFAFTCFLEFCVVMKRCCCDVINLTLFAFITEELKFLQGCINEALETKNNPGIKTSYVMNLELKAKKNSADFDSWLYFQYKISKLSNDVHKLTSPCIVVIIVCNTFNLCTAAFGITKVLDHGPMLAASGTLCSLTIIQTVLYCHAGDRVKEEGIRLSEAVCRSPWMHAHPTLVGGLNLVALDCGRSFVVRGGAFFTLSLEFFATIMGVVLSYFIVLKQMK